MATARPLSLALAKRRMRGLDTRQRALSRQWDDLRTQISESCERIGRLEQHPAYYVKADNYLDVHYYTDKKGRDRRRNFDALEQKNLAKAAILGKAHKKIVSRSYEVEEELKGVRSEIGALSRAMQERRQAIMLRRNIHKPGDFSDYVNVATRQFAEYFKRRGVKTTYFDRHVSQWGRDFQHHPPSTTIEHPETFSTIRALAAVSAQLSRQTGMVPTEGIPKALPRLLKKAGVKRILEIGPSGRGLVHMLAESGLAKRAGVELSGIDLMLSDENLKKAQELGIDLRVGDAKAIGQVFGGKKFDVIVTVAVVGPGGFSGEARNSNPPSWSNEAHRITGSAVAALSDNKNALFCATQAWHPLSLRRKRLERFSNVMHWEPASYDRSAHFAETMRMARKDGMWEEYTDYADKFDRQAADLVILGRRLSTSHRAS